MVACVLILLVASPMTSAAACLCFEDTTPAAAVHADYPQDSAPCKAACCLGGHCHHAGPALDAPISSASAPAPVVERHVVAPSQTLASLPASALERPPRG